LVGTIQTGITLLRLGDLTRFISHAVIVGFTLGAATLLVLDQLKNLLGLRALGTGDDHFLKRFWLTMSHCGEFNVSTLAVGLGTVAIALVLHWLNERFRLRLPAFLLALVAMAAVVWGWQLDQQGVRVVGLIPADLPSFEVPEIKWTRVRELASSS